MNIIIITGIVCGCYFLTKFYFERTHNFLLKIILDFLDFF